MTLFGLVSVSELVAQRKNRFLLKFSLQDNLLYAPYASKLLLVCTSVFSYNYVFSFVMIAIEFSMNKVD